MSDPAEIHASSRSDAVLDPADPRWTRLHRLIDTHSLLRGDFTLSSGRKSSYLFQLRQTTMLPEGAHLIADIVVDYMKANAISGVGGLAVGAVPLVAAIAAVSHVKGWPVEAFFVRKEAKGHGARERIDGYMPKSGDALMVDDVATTGGSILEAIAGMKEEHAETSATRALVIIDREEGAAEKLAEKGVRLVSIFKRGDFTI